MTTISDSTLIAAFASGDRSAGETLFSRYLGGVRAFLAARCRDADLAEELTQEVAARISITATRLDADGNVGAYLVRTAHNVWRDWLRRELVRRRAAPALVPNGPATGPAADEQLIARELRAALARAIEALPPAERTVVELRHRHELTFQQIADRLGRPLGTVLTQMRTALRRMQQVMEAHR